MFEVINEYYSFTEFLTKKNLSVLKVINHQQVVYAKTISHFNTFFY